MLKYLLIVLTIFGGMQSSAQLLYNTLMVDYDSAVTFKNLKIIPVRKKNPGPGAIPGLITLSQAINNGSVTISERGTASTENVHWLRLNNHSDNPVFVGAGEVITGGRQDRMVSKDTVMMPTGSDQYFQTMCVEEGRWSDKEKKFLYSGYANPRLRKVLDRQNNQLLIWKEIYAQLDSNKIVSSTLSYAARRNDKRFIQPDEEYLDYFRKNMLEKDTSIVGIICVSGKSIIGTDIFDNQRLFEGQSVSLLMGYIETAVASGSQPIVPDETVKLFMDKILDNEQAQEEYCKRSGKLFRYKGKVMHLTAYAQ